MNRFRLWIIAGAATLTLAACAAAPDEAMSGSTTGGVPLYNSSVTATNGAWGVQELGTNWGMPDPYNTLCTGACRFQGG